MRMRRLLWILDSSLFFVWSLAVGAAWIVAMADYAGMEYAVYWSVECAY